jgi:hypothetical protein
LELQNIREVLAGAFPADSEFASQELFESVPAQFQWGISVGSADVINCILAAVVWTCGRRSN